MNGGNYVPWPAKLTVTHVSPRSVWVVPWMPAPASLINGLRPSAPSSTLFASSPSRGSYGTKKLSEGADWNPCIPFQVMFWIVSKEPLAKSKKSLRPWPIMTLFVLSMTLGRGPRPLGTDLSPWGKRLGPPPQTE